jgi:hypothetical protein
VGVDTEPTFSLSRESKPESPGPAYNPRPGDTRLHRLRDAGISAAIAIGVLAAIELALRLAGYSHDVAPMTLRFGYPNPREIVDVFRPDPELFWRMRPGSTFDAEGRSPSTR